MKKNPNILISGEKNTISHTVKAEYYVHIWQKQGSEAKNMLL